jgi:tetratricopeptide (TPR) repeat protein
MMKKILVYLAVAAALALPTMARAASLDDANGAFAAGQYAESTADYEAVLAANGYSAPVLFDLGNSYFREGNYPKAILAYKRAQWLAPNDEDIQANLRLAQQQAGAPVEQAPVYAKFTSALSVNGWAWTGCAAWTLLCVFLVLRAMWPARGGLLATGAVLCGFVLLDAIAAIALSSGGMRDAVVVDKSPQALVSPFPGAGEQPGFAPAPGSTVKIEKAYNDYLLVADDAGHTGWMAKGQIEPVVR